MIKKPTVVVIDATSVEIFREPNLERLHDVAVRKKQSSSGVVVGRKINCERDGFVLPQRSLEEHLIKITSMTKLVNSGSDQTCYQQPYQNG